MIPYFDLHCDTVFECVRRGRRLRSNDLHIDLDRIKHNTLPSAQVFAIWSRPQSVLMQLAQQDSNVMEAEPLALYGQYCKLMERLKFEFRENSDIISHCRSYKDIVNASDKGKISALVSVEGAELLCCDVTKLHEAFDAGVSILNLCWNFDNALTGSNAGARGGGLTLKGRSFVRVAEQLGVILDMSHISDAGFWDVIGLTKGPVIASHSNSRRVCPHCRNLTDDMFKALLDKGGVTGINLYPEFLGKAKDLDAVVSHIEHFISLGGEKAVCLGGDLDGIDTLPHGFSGVEDLGKLYKKLRQRGHSEALCEDIFYKNALGFFKRWL